MRATHAVVAGFVMGVLVAAAPGCVNTGVCSPDCNGCCDAQGTCHSGTEETACGKEGSACISCAPDGMCSNGECFGLGVAGGAAGGDTNAGGAGGSSGGAAGGTAGGGAAGGTGGGTGGGTAGGTAGGGSSGGSGGGTAGGSVLTIDDFCMRERGARCAWYTRCGRYATEPGCVDTQARLDPLPDCGRDEKASVNDGRATFNAAGAQACLDALGTTAGCGSKLPPGPCGQLVTGTIDAGVCFSQFDCVGSQFCGSSPATCPGRCTDRKAPGTLAADVRECEAGLYLYQGRCAVLAAGGASCAPNPPTSGIKQQCVDGFFCSQTNTCTANLTQGQACMTGINVCSGFLFCGVGTCQNGGNVGQACGSSTTPRCREDLHCDSPLPAGAGTCAPAGAADAGCFATPDCASTLYCDGVVNPLPDGGALKGHCLPLKSQSTMCRPVTPSECQPQLYCAITGAGCVPRLSAGQGCTSDPQCAPRLVCSGAAGCQPADCYDPTP